MRLHTINFHFDKETFLIECGLGFNKKKKKCLLLPLTTKMIFISKLSTVVSQFYESQVSDEYVIKGNAAVLKCNIPSFVSDHVEVIAWVDTSGGQYLRENNSGIILLFLY